MRYRKLSPLGDYTFGAGQLNFYIDVPDAVGQAAKTRILLFLGEWYLDIEDGTAFLEGIIGKHSQATADATLQDRINGTTGLVSTQNYTSVIDPNTRKFSVSVELITQYGATLLQVANYASF